MLIKTVGTLIFLPGFVVAMFPSTALSSSSASLSGYWNCEEEGARYTLEFKTESQLVYNGQSLNYQLQDNVLLVQEEYGFTPYVFEIKKTGLTFLSPDGSVSRCQKGEAVQASKPTKKPSTAKATTDVQTLVPGRNWPAYVRPSGNVSWESSDPQALLYKFSGRWDNYSGSTLSNIYLKPEGSFSDSSETSYSGSFSDQAGYQTGAWGTVGQSQGGGYWSIKGTLSRGVITLVRSNGQHKVINYQVHVKNGEYYGGEYFFNGALHSVNYIYR
ncbi:MAG: hypothetical protein KAJ92_05430 [Gammaproteobacteria bacterium]|nr:hypothetical protein [Gammaproteobacteria bacterium]MCK5263105.1 hypothetical protein [Gammaproteobacteria bacterium]